MPAATKPARSPPGKIGQGSPRKAMAQTSVVKEVGKKIRQLRLSRVGPRMTQEELSQKARISVSFLSMIERGERSPHLETLAKIAAALEVPLSDLFHGDLSGNHDVVEPLLRPLVEACRRYDLGKRDVDRLVAVVKSMFQP
ncbi:MAG TPA: helix-turn-helix transcriptional regulator [Myxococcales bacterium]|nr:helix-turn-helix transcriptional regulator [Myxococcales bacterium]